MRTHARWLIALILFAAMMLLTVSAFATDVWYCPKCGLQNSDNFCPRDGTAKPVDALYGTGPTTTPAPSFTPILGLTTMKIATRSGPATEYTGTGTYQAQDQYLPIYSIVYDVNGVAWVQCEVTYAGSPRRVYTGLKRFDTSTFPVDQIPEEWSRGVAQITASATLRYGPGDEYASMKIDVSSGLWVTITNVENGWYQVEFQSADEKVRGWIPSACAY